MAEYAYPKALTGMQDTQWSSYMLNVIEDGATEDGAFAPFANGSGMFITLASGHAIIQGVLGGDDNPATVNIPAAPAIASGMSRIDTVVKRLNRSATPVIQTFVVSGTESANPAPPQLEQDPSGIWEWPVANVLVGPGVVSITSAKITDRRSFIGANVRLWDSRPTNPRLGTLGYNRTTGVWEWFDGPGGWKELVPSGTLPISKGGTGATSASAARDNLGILVRPEPMTSGTPINTIRLW